MAGSSGSGCLQLCGLYQPLCIMMTELLGSWSSEDLTPRHLVQEMPLRAFCPIHISSILGNRSSLPKDTWDS